MNNNKTYMGDICVLKEKNRLPLIVSTDGDSEDEELKETLYNTISGQPTIIHNALYDLLKENPDTFKNGCMHEFSVYRGNTENKITLEFEYGYKIYKHPHIGTVDDKAPTIYP